MSANNQIEKPLCFVIGPIADDGTKERKHADMLLNVILKHVLEAEEFGYRVKRSDEDAKPGMINDRVVIDIINAELVIADLTDLNANAFYELGIRHATEKPTIHVAKDRTDLPFDTSGHRAIFIDLTDWHSIETGRKSLAASVRTIKEPDFQVSNPITQANASFKMRESSDSRDQITALMLERLSVVEEQLKRMSDHLELQASRDPSLANLRNFGYATGLLEPISGHGLASSLGSLEMKTRVGRLD